jgi:ATP-dependent Lon protease
MSSYNDNEKKEIGKRFVFPRYLAEAGLTLGQLKIEDSTWEKLVRPLGFEPGIRSLERQIEIIVRKTAYKIVSGQVASVVVNDENLREFVV